MIDNPKPHELLAFLRTASRHKLAEEQIKATELLFEKFGSFPASEESSRDIHYQNLRTMVAIPNCVFVLLALQREIYHIDTGTSFVPRSVQKVLLNIKSRFVVRPLSIEQIFVYRRGLCLKLTKYILEIAKRYYLAFQIIVLI